VGEGDEERLCLRLATPDDVPKLSRAEVFITGEPPGEHRFLKNLQAQNPGLHTDRWVLKHHQETSNSQLLVFGIDPDSVAALATTDYHAYFRLGRVTFRVAQTPARSEAT